jgi:hypothetical protein
MRKFSGVPAEYVSHIEGQVAQMVDDARKDAWRRANGHPPSLPPFAYDEKRKGRTVSVVLILCLEEPATDR